MTLRVMTDIASFNQQALPLLEAKEVENNLQIGILRSLEERKSQERPFLAFYEEEEKISLILVITPPQNVVITATGDFKEAHLVPLVKDLQRLQVSLPGVIANTPISSLFATEWARQTGVEVRVSMRQRIFKLVELNDLLKPEGSLRLAGNEDLPLVQTWIQNFYEEALDQNPHTDYEGIAKRFIERQALYLFGDEQVYSMAGKTRATSAGVSISLVYTPKEHRGKGYATFCVYALSSLLLKEYSYISLYTDLANPTSNSIYAKIGFRPVCDSEVYAFHAES